ncbi:hypothetical protein [Streptomyces sp. NPDC002580]
MPHEVRAARAGARPKDTVKVFAVDFDDRSEAPRHGSVVIP